MLQFNFSRNRILTVRALRWRSRLCKGMISSSWGEDEQWYSCRNWITICQGCSSNESPVYIIEHHKGFILSLATISEESKPSADIKSSSWKEGFLKPFRSDSTKSVRVVPKCRYIRTSVWLVWGQISKSHMISFLSPLQDIVLVTVSSLLHITFPSLLEALPSTCNQVAWDAPQILKNHPHFYFKCLIGE